MPWSGSTSAHTRRVLFYPWLKMMCGVFPGFPVLLAIVLPTTGDAFTRLQLEGHPSCSLLANRILVTILHEVAGALGTDGESNPVL